MNGDPNPKRAQQIVEAMIREIIALDWPVGHLLGREPELLERWHVSRAVFREAVAVAEKQDLIEMRRGRAGGLVVKAEPAQCAATTIRRYLTLTGFDGRELSQTRAALEGLLIQQACARIDSAAAAKLRALLAEAPVDTEDEFRLALALMRELAEVCRNPCLSIFIRATAELTYRLLNGAEVSAADQAVFARRTLELRRAQVEAVIGSDVGAAFALQQELDRTRDSVLNPLRLDHDLAADSLDEGQSRLADAVSARLLADVRSREWPAGATIGTLQSLSEQYGVSLGVLRAVIRRLEHVGAVRMEAGRSGGLQVATPAPQQTIASAILYINCARPSLPDIVATQETLELAAITLAAQSGDVIGPQLQALAEPVLPPTQALHDFGRSHFLTLVEASGNRVLLLLIRILAAQLSAQHFMMQQPSPQALFNDYLEQFRRIVAAIRAGDVALARRGALDLHRFIAGLELRRLSPDELQSESA